MDLDIQRGRTCQRCRAVVLLEKIRLFPKPDSTNMLVCNQCCDELKSALKDQTPSLRSNIKPLPPADYCSYFCDRCNYLFRVDRAKAGLTHRLHCPYCGKEDRIQKRGEKNALRASAQPSHP